MIGRNEIRLNMATMLEAVQLWLDKNFVNAPKAHEIQTETSGHSKTFTIIVEPEDGKENDS